jgi:uncharacterized protein YegP (UPF0339 family)
MRKLKIQIYKSGIIIKDWKWKAVASNGRIIASGRGFNNKQLAEQSVQNLINYIKQDNYKIEL